MSINIAQLIRVSMVFIPLLLLAGFYCIMVSRNLIRTLIGLEILTKGVTLLIIVAGYVTGYMAVAQSFAITLIIIEVVVLAVAAGLIVNVFRHTDSLDRRNLQNLRG
jgi:multisubunit Na+/H+ antiporter MnhC subunit